ncbi:MAG: flagellar biosynthetic protein FliO [Phycisphaerales bacterium]|nr:MAG: flagellar biosynthetic protein FliO [Phycisphaerales bacterium]
MFQRTRLLLIAACSFLITTPALVLAEPDSPAVPVANDPAVIEQRELSGPPGTESPHPTIDESGRSARAESAPDGSSPAPANEDKALGIPNGLLSARPVESPDRNARSGLRALDPRRNDAVRVGLALGGVILLLLLLRGVVRRGASALAGGSRPSGVVEVLARYPVARHQQLMLLKLGRRVVLLHQGGGRMAALTEITDPDEVASLLASLEAGSRQKEALRFRSILKSFEREHASRQAGRSGIGLPGRERADEVIDLTRRGGGGAGGWFARRRSIA